MNYPLAKRTIREMALWARRIWKGCPHYVLIENAGYGVELIIDLKREIDRCAEDQPRSGRQQGDPRRVCLRCAGVRQLLPAGDRTTRPPRLNEHSSPADVVGFVTNCALFPNALHDDDVDAWSQFGNWLRSKSTVPIRTGNRRRRARGDMITILVPVLGRPERAQPLVDSIRSSGGRAAPDPVSLLCRVIRMRSWPAITPMSSS